MDFNNLTRPQTNQLALLGAVMLGAEGAEDAVRRLRPEMFSPGDIREVFEGIRALVLDGQPVDTVTLGNKIRLDAAKKQLILFAADTLPAITAVDRYEAFILEDWRQETIQSVLLGLTMSDESADSLCGRLQNLLDAQNALRDAALDASAREFDAVVDETMAAIAGPSNKLVSGWANVDRMGFLTRGNTVVVAGRPGCGKTDLTLNLAARLSGRYRVYYLTMEETRSRLMERLLCKVTRIDSGRVRDRNLAPEELQSLHNAGAALKKHHNMVLDDGAALTVEDIRAKVLRYQPELVVIDHIGLVQGDAKQKEFERLAEVTRTLKILAKQCGCVVVELVQLNRGVDKTGGSKSAKLSDLRGSGTIEADANAVLFLEQDMQGEEDLRGADSWKDVDVRLAKNREGPTGRITMRWQPQYHSWQPAPDPAHDYTDLDMANAPAAVQQAFS